MIQENTTLKQIFYQCNSSFKPNKLKRATLLAKVACFLGLGNIDHNIDRNGRSDNQNISLG